MPSPDDYFYGKREVEIMATDSKQYRELGCKDFKADCDFMVRAETSEEVMRYCQEHVCNAHGKCESSPETVEKIKSRIRRVWT